MIKGTFRDLRKKAGMSHTDVAKLLGISRGMASHIDAGRRGLSKVNAEILAAHFGVGLDTFEGMTPPNKKVAKYHFIKADDGTWTLSLEAHGANHGTLTVVEIDGEVVATRLRPAVNFVGDDK